MLFDSWAGAVPASCRQSVIIDLHNQIIHDLRANGINLPILSFPKGLSEGLKSYSEQVDIQGLGLDHYVDRYWAARNLRSDLVLQESRSAMFGSGRGPTKSGSRRYIRVFFRAPAYFQSWAWIVPQTPLNM